MSPATSFSGTSKSRRAFRAFTVERLFYGAGQVIPAHHHAGPAVILLVDGHCTLSNDLHRGLPCAPGAMIVHPAGEWHSYRYQADGESQMLAITFPIQPCDRFCTVDLNCPRVTDDPEIAPLALRLRRRVEQPHTSALSIETTVFELLGLIGGDSHQSAATPSLTRVRDLLHNHFKEPLSVTDIARTAELSAIQLLRHFRRQFGTSLGAYVRNLRLTYACERLASSALPIVDLAQELGFFDQSHFCHAFRKRFGISPIVYRQQHRRR